MKMSFLKEYRHDGSTRRLKSRNAADAEGISVAPDSPNAGGLGVLQRPAREIGCLDLEMSRARGCWFCGNAEGLHSPILTGPRSRELEIRNC